MNPSEFIAKWAPVQLAERAASQEHFIDLCRLLGQPTPAEQDATGAEFTFEKFTAVTGGVSAGALLSQVARRGKEKRTGPPLEMEKYG